MIGGALCGKRVKGLLSMAMQFVEKFRRSVGGLCGRTWKGRGSGLTHPALSFSSNLVSWQIGAIVRNPSSAREENFQPLLILNLTASSIRLAVTWLRKI